MGVYVRSIALLALYRRSFIRFATVSAGADVFPFDLDRLNTCDIRIIFYCVHVDTYVCIRIGLACGLIVVRGLVVAGFSFSFRVFFALLKRAGVIVFCVERRRDVSQQQKHPIRRTPLLWKVSTPMK